MITRNSLLPVLPNRSRYFSLRKYLFFLTFFVLVLATTLLHATEDNTRITADPHPPFRLCFSANMFHNVNQTDIMAALKVWILTVAKDLNIEVDPNPNIQPSIAAMIDFTERNHVSGFAALATELIELRKYFDFDKVAVGQNRGVFGNQYIILVRSDSNIQSLDQLKNRDIIFYDSPHMSLGRIWLETMLLEQNLGLVDDYFSISQKASKPTQVVLPVFFGKTKACLITKDTFEVMKELNPQLGQQLRSIKQSPVMISAGFAFLKRDENRGYRDEIIDAMGKLDRSQAGQQLLAMTQSSVIKSLPIAKMEESFALIRKHTLLLQEYKYRM